MDNGQERCKCPSWPGVPSAWCLGSENQLKRCSLPLAPGPVGVGFLGPTPVGTSAVTQTGTQHVADLWLRDRAGLQFSAASRAATVWARNPGKGGRRRTGKAEQTGVGILELETSPETTRLYLAVCQDPLGT